MAVTGKVYYPMLSYALQGDIDINTHNIRVVLSTSGYTPSQAHTFLSSVGANEISGTGYTAEGQTLASCAVAAAGTATTKFTATNAEWTGATVAARYAIIYCRNTGLGANSASWPLIGWVDFGDTMSASAGTFTIAWSTNGIVTITTD
jgi:hypothetical protein